MIHDIHFPSTSNIHIVHAGLFRCFYKTPNSEHGLQDLQCAHVDFVCTLVHTGDCDMPGYALALRVSSKFNFRELSGQAQQSQVCHGHPSNLVTTLSQACLSRASVLALLAQFQSSDFNTENTGSFSCTPHAGQVMATCTQTFSSATTLSSRDTPLSLSLTHTHTHCHNFTQQRHSLSLSHTHTHTQTTTTKSVTCLNQGNALHAVLTLSSASLSM